MKSLKYVLGLVLSVLLVTSCASKWPYYTVTNDDVTWELEGNTYSLNAEETPIVITIQRGVATEAASVPLTLEDTHGIYTLTPSKVDFAAGEYVKTVTLTYQYAGLTPGTEYTFNLKFPDSQAGAGCYNEFAGNGMMQLEYEDYKDVEYEVFWFVNASATAFTYRIGSIDEACDVTEVKLMRAKSTKNYYKFCVWGTGGNFTELEFKNNGDESITVSKYAGYNENITLNTSTNRAVYTATVAGHTYSFTTRIANCGVYGSGNVEIQTGDEIEMEGWVQKDGAYYPNSYNTYRDYLVD
ncbi:MAG: hypothetical protein IKX26_06980 [Bacteroidales bacterium]|nr:hypothetical protein [Bacteroidales bacterium]